MFSKIGNQAKKLNRRLTQKHISFPIAPEDINRDMLSPLDPFGTEDSDTEEQKQM